MITADAKVHKQTLMDIFLYSFCIMSEVYISVLINEIYKSLTFFYEFAIFNIQVAEGEN